MLAAENTSAKDDNLNIVSSGTCFFVDSAGTAVTNHHVVDGAETIRIVANDGTTWEARIVKSSEIIDLALLSTEAPSKSYLSLAEVGSISLGEEVFTIGYPATSILGEKPKYSEGVISGLTGVQDDDTWLQVSVPIQPGNSGGPLVNRSGEVVGIVTATAAVKRFFAATGSLPQNVSWAVKADYARAMIPSTKVTVPLGARTDVVAHVEKSTCRVMALERTSGQEEARTDAAVLGASPWENYSVDPVITASGLEYKVLVRGHGRRPGPRDRVTVHYKSWLENGWEVDNSYARGTPATFPVGKVIAGWTEGLQLMREGSVFVFRVPPELAYGKIGSGLIPPNATLVFEVGLLQVR